jgi:hypothetical protein
MTRVNREQCSNSSRGRWCSTRDKSYRAPRELPSRSRGSYSRCTQQKVEGEQKRRAPGRRRSAALVPITFLAYNALGDVGSVPVLFVAVCGQVSVDIRRRGEPVTDCQIRVIVVPAMACRCPGIIGRPDQVKRNSWLATRQLQDE